MNWLKAKWTALKAWAKRVWRGITGFIVALMASLGLLVVAQDTSITLSWENAIQYENGDPLPISDIQETKIWRASYPVGGNDGSVPFSHIDTVTPDITTYIDASPGSGEHCFYLTHVSDNGAESIPSNEVCTTRDNRVPGSPQNLTVQ